MALKARLTKDEHAALPELLRKEYVEKDGRFQLDVTADGTFALHDSEGLKKALENERTGSEELKKQLRSFEGLDASEAREAVKNKTVYKGGADERLTAAEQKWKTESEAAKAKFEKEVATRESFIKRTLAQAAIKAANGNPELLMPHVLPRIGAAPVGDGFDVFVVDETGKPVMTKVAGGAGNMSIAEHLSALKANEAFKGAFFSDMKSGMGSTSSPGGGAGGGTTITRGDLAAAGANIAALAEGKVTVN